MKAGLVTLADLPDLAAGRNRTTIVVARLDDNLRDPRYGAFKITQADVDGWTRNLTETFGGRVAIDFDHSSDRGNGTRAAAWITGLHQQGKLVTADVEFTPKGAKSIRNGDYRYISPTFVANYTDEHGEKHGRALIGAALTNRPVLRKGMPTLSLSRDRFDAVATPNRRKKGSAMSKQNKANRQAAKALGIDGGVVVLDRQGQPLSAKAIRKMIKKALKQGRRLPGTKIAPPGPRSDPPKGPGGLVDVLSRRDLDTRQLAMTTDVTERSMTLSAEQAAGMPRSGKQLRKLALNAGADPEAVRMMMEPDVDPELRLMFFQQLIPDVVALGLPSTSSDTPFTMDTDRYQLHQNAKLMAEARCKANPALDPGEAYILATQQLADAQDPEAIF